MENGGMGRFVARLKKNARIEDEKMVFYDAEWISSEPLPVNAPNPQAGCVKTFPLDAVQTGTDAE